MPTLCQGSLSENRNQLKAIQQHVDGLMQAGCATSRLCSKLPSLHKSSLWTLDYARQDVMDRTMKSSDDEAGHGPKDKVYRTRPNLLCLGGVCYQEPGMTGLICCLCFDLLGSAYKSGQAGAAGTTGLEPSTQLSLHSVHISVIFCTCLLGYNEY